MIRSPGPPRVAEWLLQAVLPRDVVGRSILGDLREEYARRARDLLRPAQRWYWRAAFAVLSRRLAGRIGRRHGAPAGVRRVGAPPTASPTARFTMGAQLWSDLRYAVRMFVKNPGFTTVAVVSLGLGIGANTTIFTMINAVFLNPLPVEDVQALVNVYTTDQNVSGIGNLQPVSYHNYRDLNEQNDVFTEMAGYMQLAATLNVNNAPEQVATTMVTANYFDALGVRPLVGRTFLEDEDQGMGAYPVAVMSHALWTRILGGDPATIGTTIRLNTYPFTLVGVTPPEFRGVAALDNAEQVWVTLSMRNEVITPQFAALFDGRRALFFSAFARLRPGIELPRASAAIEAIAVRLAEAYPRDNEGRGAALVPMAEAAVGGPNQRTGWVRAGAVLMGVVGLVLLIACVNLANLLLARSAVRSKEMSLRVALGAGRARIVRQLLTESLVLSAAGGVAGVLIAVWGRSLLWSFRPVTLPDNALDLSLDVRVLVFAAAVSLLTGVLFGLLPALKASAPDLHEALKVGGRQGSAGFGRSSLRSTLVVAEVALAVVTLIGAGLFVRSMQAALEVDLGFEADRIFVFGMNVASSGHTPDTGREFYRRLLERVGTVPGVESATIASNFPFGGSFQRTVFPEGQETDPNRQNRLSWTVNVTPSYFETLGIGRRDGRLMTEFDRESTTRIAVINEAAAERYWPGEDPIGRRFTFFGDQEPREIAGIVGNTVVSQLGESPQSIFYLPLAQEYSFFVTVQVRTAGDPGPVMATVVREVQPLDPELALTNQSTMRDLLDQALWARRMGAALLTIFGALALVLAAVGIYGVIAYATNQRRHEIGIRLAVGAQAGIVLKMVIGQGMRIAALGIVVGFLAAVIVTRFASTLLLGVSPVDPPTYTVIGILLGSVALAATAIPAFRATRVDALIALRTE